MKSLFSHRSFRMLLLPVLLLALIGMTCPFSDIGMPAPTTPTSGDGGNRPPEATLTGPCSFNTTSGAYVGGWYWLRDDAYMHAGLWDCTGLPTDRDLTVSLQALVTNQAEGGSGYSSPVKVTYTNPASQASQTIQVYLQNPLQEQSPANSQGAGYPVTGYFVIPKTFMDANGGLTIRLERLSPNPYHVAVNAASLAFDQPRRADSFNQSGGNLVVGWYWLRESAGQAYGEWTFTGLNPAGQATLVFDLLVTNGAGGGSGYSMPFELTLINPSDNTQKTLRHVMAQNLFFVQEAANSKGVGYQTYGSIALQASLIDARGNLIVRVARLPDADNHLAVNQNSVGVIQPGTAHDLATASPSPTVVSDRFDLKGKYLFIQYWNKVDGTGSLPALAIDFPDYRFDPENGTLEAFNPSQAITLSPADWGFVGHGTSRSGDAGTGAVSSLETISQIPFSMDVGMFTGSFNLQAAPNMEETRRLALRVISVGEDGTVAFELADQTFTLAPGQSWTQTTQADVNEGKYNGHLTLTSTLTNYGWQDRAKINLPK